MKLIANRHLTYGTRRLLPGDAFEASDREARVLIAVKKAAPAGAGAHKRSVLVRAPVDDLAALRKKYQEVSGKRPFHGWDADALRSKIAEAKDAN